MSSVTGFSKILFHFPSKFVVFEKEISKTLIDGTTMEKCCRPRILIQRHIITRQTITITITIVYIYDCFTFMSIRSRMMEYNLFACFEMFCNNLLSAKNLKYFHSVSAWMN